MPRLSIGDGAGYFRWRQSVMSWHKSFTVQSQFSHSLGNYDVGDPHTLECPLSFSLWCV